MEKLLYIVEAIAIPAALLLCVILAAELRKLMGVTHLYREPGRDIRFARSLLGLYVPGAKWRIIEKPCFFTDDRIAPAHADLLIVGKKGVMILTVDPRGGHFSTPPTGAWTMWQDGKGQRIPNRFDEGWKYADVIQQIMEKNGIDCPVSNCILLSDDDALIDDLYSENVFTGAQLVPHAKWFCKGRGLSQKKQKTLIAAINAYGQECRKSIEEAKRNKSAASMSFFENLLADAELPAEDSQEETDQ